MRVVWTPLSPLTDSNPFQEKSSYPYSNPFVVWNPLSPLTAQPPVSGGLAAIPKPYSHCS